MSDIAIRVENLSKRYHIGQLHQRHDTLRDALVDSLTRITRIGGKKNSNNSLNSCQKESIWALKDVSFEVKRGEVVGIIGRNGAGKSTLLKILSRITEPTSGQAIIHGRVGSLLEVGTGFHPELTGRENIYLNGAILGMRKREIDKKFDEIVAFAEIEKFIDTPVKRYSSGMYVRLAFAVAAHLEPEILLVDEVLAVGDIEFQKKCLGKMGDVAKGGRTVLFVSHNMAAVKSLCDWAMLLNDGHVICEGGVNQVVDAYLGIGTEMFKTGIIPDDAPRIGTGDGRVRRVELLNLAGDPISQLYLGQPFHVVLTLEVTKDIRDAVIEVGISTLDGVRVTSSFTVDGGQPPITLPKGWCRVSLDLNPVLLPRYYMLDVGIHKLSGVTMDFVERALGFAVINVAENGTDHYHWRSVRGLVRPPGRWHPPEPTEVLST